jgi:hypothetical protein
MTCETFYRALEAFLDGEVHGEARTALERHLQECDACRVLLADVQRISRLATALERHQPPRDGWTRLSAGLATETARRGSAWRRVSYLAAAAALIAALGTTLFVVRRDRESAPAAPAVSRESAQPADRGQPTSQPARNVPREALVESIENELQLAATHYENAISGLQKIANATDSPLDPAVTAKIRQDLTVIDKAIDDSRKALRAYPENQLAQESLFEAFRRKVALLQDTIALMNEMRKGNPEAGARVPGDAEKS